MSCKMNFISQMPETMLLSIIKQKISTLICSKMKRNVMQQLKLTLIYLMMRILLKFRHLQFWKILRKSKNTLNKNLKLSYLNLVKLLRKIFNLLRRRMPIYQPVNLNFEKHLIQSLKTQKKRKMMFTLKLRTRIPFG